MDEDVHSNRPESNGPAEAHELLDLKHEHDDEKPDKVAELPKGEDIFFSFSTLNKGDREKHV